MIDGNAEAEIQVKSATKNEIGETIETYSTVQALTGFLDLQSGDSKYLTYNAKMQESTHIFICDYEPLSADITAENSRMVISGQRYDIMLLDNPMGLNEHLEIYLKYTGGQCDVR